MEIQKNGELTISEFASLLIPYDLKSDGHASSFRKLFDSCVDEYNSSHTGNPKWAKDECSYNPLHNMENDTLTRYCNGRMQIASASLRKMQPFLNENNFTRYYSGLNIPEEADDKLYTAVKNLYPKADKENLAPAYWAVLMRLIDDGANRKTKKTGPKPVLPVSPLCSADTEGDFEERVKSAIQTIVAQTNSDFLSENVLPPLHISEKITDTVLCRDVENDMDYYPLVNSAFVEASDSSGKPCEYILQSVHRQYEKLAQQSAYSEQQIVQGMQSFFSDKAGLLPDSSACRIITSYFIQLCEVFHGSSGKNSGL
jgi:hypothetical protein